MPVDQERGSRHSPWWLWIVVVDLSLVLVTSATETLNSIPFVWRIDHLLRLTSEFNLAAWWSSILLFAGGLLCYEVANRDLHGKKWPWLVLSAVFLALSLDEMGSIHERLKWLGLSLSGLIFAICISYAVINLYRVPHLRKTVMYLISGFCVLGTVPAQEYIQPLIPWNTHVLLCIEEGTELLGVLLLLAGVVQQLKVEKGYSHIDLILDLRMRIGFATFVVVGLVVNLGVCILFVDNLDYIPLRGNPGLWYPMAVNFLLSCHVIWKASISRQDKWALCVVAILFLCASAWVVADLTLIIPGTVWFDEGYLMPRIVAGYIFQGIGVVWWVTITDSWRHRWVWVALAGLALVLCIPWLFASTPGIRLGLFSLFVAIGALIVASSVEDKDRDISVPVVS